MPIRSPFKKKSSTPDVITADYTISDPVKEGELLCNDPSKENCAKCEFGPSGNGECEGLKDPEQPKLRCDDPSEEKCKDCKIGPSGSKKCPGFQKPAAPVETKAYSYKFYVGDRCVDMGIVTAPKGTDVKVIMTRCADDKAAVNVIVPEDDTSLVYPPRPKP